MRRITVFQWKGGLGLLNLIASLAGQQRPFGLCFDKIINEYLHLSREVHPNLRSLLTLQLLSSPDWQT